MSSVRTHKEQVKSRFSLLLGLGLMLGQRTFTGAEENAVRGMDAAAIKAMDEARFYRINYPMPPPFTFRVAGLTPEEIESVSKVPGVLEVAESGTKTSIRWMPWVKDESAIFGRKWIKGAEAIAKVFAIKSSTADMRFTNAGPVNIAAGTIIYPWINTINFLVRFDDLTKRCGVELAIDCFGGGERAKVEHEMLRYVPGANAQTVKCGDGYVVVTREVGGTFVVWQAAEQMFVRIDNYFRPEPVAAYVNRLGSITPKDIDLTVDRWVENEIRYRLCHMHYYHSLRVANKWPKSVISPDVDMVSRTFSSIKGMPGKRKFVYDKETVEQEWEYMNLIARWLWANRKNFKYNWDRRDYILKGPDQYDPQNPPELPEEMRPPPRPQPEVPSAQETPVHQE